MNPDFSDGKRLAHALVFILVVPLTCATAEELPLEKAAVLMGLTSPTAITKVSYFGDGGSIGMILTDSKGKTFQLVLERQLDMGAETVSSPKLFVGSDIPGAPGAQKVPKDSMLEKAILVTLRSCVETYSKMSEEEQNSKSIRRYSGAAKQFINAIEANRKL